MAAGILEVKLGRPRYMTTRRLRALLIQARRDCCKVRNAVVTHWLLWRRQNPDWTPGGPYTPPPRRIKAASGRADPKQGAKYRRLLDTLAAETNPQKRAKLQAKVDRFDAPKGPPKDPPYAPREFLSRELYGVGIKAAPLLNTSVLSSCVQEASKRLAANVPYDHDGDARWTWQAILASEVSLPTWRFGRIPVPRGNAKLVYDDTGCWLQFPLLSKQSGYKRLSQTVGLLCGKLTGGNRRLLKRLADGTQRLADSQLIERDGNWYAQLVYDVSVEGSGLPKDRPLTLVPGGPEDEWPFRVQWIDTEGQSHNRTFGRCKPLIAEYRRIVARRRGIQYQRRLKESGKHGKDNYFGALRQLSRYVGNICTLWQKQFIADVMKLAIQEECGAIVYREPTKPVRERVFFARQDLPFNWTAFAGRLKFKAVTKGLEYSTSRNAMEEWRGPDKEKKGEAQGG